MIKKYKSELTSPQEEEHWLHLLQGSLEQQSLILQDLLSLISAPQMPAF